MRPTKGGSVVGLSAAFIVLAGLRCAGRASDTIEIGARGADYEITLPSSKVVLVVPKEGWVPMEKNRGGSSASPHYFALADEAKGLMVSGWMEPANRYSGLKSMWEDDLKAWREHGVPDPLNVDFKRLGDWEVATYDMPMPAGASNTHIRAEWTGQGTWIDAHLSLTSAQSLEDARKHIQDVFGGLRVKSK